MIPMRTLTAKEIERLENTSIASLLAAASVSDLSVVADFCEVDSTTPLCDLDSKCIAGSVCIEFSQCVASCVLGTICDDSCEDSCTEVTNGVGELSQANFTTLLRKALQ